jgi:hypothetical protein
MLVMAITYRVKKIISIPKEALPFPIRCFSLKFFLRYAKKPIHNKNEKGSCEICFIPLIPCLFPTRSRGDVAGGVSDGQESRLKGAGTNTVTAE